MTTHEASLPAFQELQRVMQLAQVQVNLGRTRRALALYEEALAADPGHTEAFVGAMTLRRQLEDWEGLVAQCDRWLARFPDHAAHPYTDRVHNHRISALVRVGGIEHAFQAYELELVSSGPVRLGADEIIVFLGVRNEVVRLPYLFEHHRRLGVDRFLVVDNASDDGTFEFLCEQPDALVWRAHGSFRQANNGAAWADLVLRRHVDGQWCLVLDADELFVYPGFEDRGMRALCDELDRDGSTCYPALMLDMYGKGRLSEARYHAGQNPLDVFPYFDHAFYRLREPFAGPRHNMTNYWGGVRARVFGGGLGGYLLHKVPLHRYVPGQLMISGNHWLDRPGEEISAGRGALLHFKYGDAFTRDVAKEAEREEHARGAWVYKHYVRTLEARPDPVLYDDAYSVRFRDSAQLVDLGLMVDPTGPPRAGARRSSASIPAVPRVVPGSARPTWSVVVRAEGDPATRPAARIGAVLRALEGEPVSEVVMVVTASGPAPPSASFETTEHQVVVVRSDQHLTELEAANLGLRATRGAWVHILGSAPAPPPSFYAGLRSVLDGHDLGVVTNGEAAPVSATNVDFSIPSACIIARRELFETAGGLCTTIPAAAAWELLVRLSHSSSVGVATIRSDDWFDEVIRHACRRTSGLGEAVVHWRDAVQLVAETGALGATEIDELRERCAIQAAAMVRRELDAGSFVSALATVAEALRPPVTDAARGAVLEAVWERLR